jgi:hypothetical protein
VGRVVRERIQSQDKIHIMGIDEFVKLEGIEEGIEIGREEKSRLFVENLLRETDFSSEKISGLADVTVDYVNEVRKSVKAG